MATKLKDLKFGDYTLKGVENGDYGGIKYKLGDQDALTYEYTENGVLHEDAILDRSWSLGCSSTWHFHGGADYAGSAEMVAVEEEGASNSRRLYGTPIPTFSKGGSMATVDELEYWINRFVSQFYGGSTYVISGTFTPSP